MAQLGGALVRLRMRLRSCKCDELYAYGLGVWGSTAWDDTNRRVSDERSSAW